MMKQLISTYLFIFLASWVFAQDITITVNGTVSDTDGNGVENVQITIFTDSLSNWQGYHGTVTSITDGSYTDSFDVPSSLTQGTIYVSMTDCNGNFQNKTTSWFPGADIVVDFVYCNYVCTAQIEENPSGSLSVITQGEAPFAYSWNTNEITAEITPTTTGTYCVIVTDVDGCVAEDCYYYESGGNVDTLCVAEIYLDSAQNGQWALTAWAYGQAPYTYAWSDGSVNPTIIPNDYGTYCVTITDADNCVSTACYDWGGFCEVYVNETIAGLQAYSYGTAPFTYLWNTGDSTEIITPGQDGTYCVTVTDAADCISSSCISIYTQQDSCSVYISQVQNGAWLQATASGVAPFSYLWNTGSSTSAIALNSTGNYCVTTTDATGCIAEDCFYYDPVGNDTLCSADIYLDTLNSQWALSVWASGQAPFSYLWSNGSTNTTITPDQYGTYCVTVSDANNCISEACYDWDGFCGVNIYETNAGLSANGYGVAPYTYSWSTGELIQLITPDAYGTYCVTMTDAAGCSSTDCRTLVQDSIYFISGYVYTLDSLNTALSGKVILYQLENGAVTAVDTTSFGPQGSYYVFHIEEEGEYIVKAMLGEDSPYYDAYAPTYYQNALWWDEATPIAVPSFFNISADIHLIATNDQNGPGLVEGNVQNSDDFHGGEIEIRNGESMEGILIILLNEADLPVAYTFTDAEGKFLFEDLALGTYSVYVELPGYEQAYYTLTLSQDNPEVRDLTFEITETTILETLQLLDDTSLRIYPNPVEDLLQIEISIENVNELKLEIVNLTGQTVYQKIQNRVSPKESFELDLSNLNSGIYFLSVYTDKGFITKRIVKQ